MAYRDSGSRGPSGKMASSHGSTGSGTFLSDEFAYDQQRRSGFSSFLNQRKYDDGSDNFSRSGAISKPAYGGYKIYPNSAEDDVRQYDAGADISRQFADNQPRRVVSVNRIYTDQQTSKSWGSGQGGNQRLDNLYREQEKGYSNRQVEDVYSADEMHYDAAYGNRQGESYGRKAQGQGRYDEYVPRKDDRYSQGRSESMSRQEIPSRRQEYFREPAAPVQSRVSQAGLLGEAPQSHSNVLQQLAPQAQLALANTLISALVQGQQQQQMPPPQTMGNYSGVYGPGADYGRRDARDLNRPGDRGFRRDDRRGPPEKMQRTEGGRRDFGNRRDNDRRARSPERKRKVPTKSTPNRQKQDKNKGDKKENAQAWKGQRHPKDEEDNTQYKDLPKKYLFCHLCYKAMWNGPSFERHISGHVHLEVVRKTEEMYEARIEALRLTSQLAEEKRESADQRKGPNHREEHCAMCDSYFSGKLTAHRKSEAHIALKNFIHPRCHVCDKNFHSRVEKDEHLLTAAHMKKLYALEGDDEKKVEDTTEADEGIDETYDPENPTEDDVKPAAAGTEVTSAKDPNLRLRSLYFCKVCCLYFNHQEMAFDRHCRTVEHHDHYGYAVAVRRNLKKQKTPEALPAAKDEGEMSDDDGGNWKRRGAKKHDETDYEESVSQETDASMIEAQAEEALGETMVADKQELEMGGDEEQTANEQVEQDGEPVSQAAESEGDKQPDVDNGSAGVEVKDEPLPVKEEVVEEIKSAESPKKEVKPVKKPETNKQVPEAKKPAAPTKKPEPAKKVEAVAKKLEPPAKKVDVTKKAEPAKKSEPAKKVVPMTPKPGSTAAKAVAATPAPATSTPKTSTAVRGKNTAVRGRGTARGRSS